MNYHINVLIDDYADMNLRSKLVINGVHEEAYQKKITVRTFFSVDTLIEAMAKERRKFVIVISESKLNSEKVLWTLNEKNIHPIFIRMPFPNAYYSFSSIIPNYFPAIYHLTRMILNDFPEPSVFLGYNADSIADKNRLDGFIKAVDEYKVPHSVVTHHGDIGKSIDEFMDEIHKYKNIVCTNDVIALLLLRRMKEMNVEYIKFNITGCGNFRVGEYFKPSLTTITSDYYDLGTMAVNMYVFLFKKNQRQNMFINIDCRIILRESTHIKSKNNNKGPVPELFGEMVDFYGDNLVKEIDSLEKMLVSCDEIDKSILQGMLANFTYEKIAEINLLAVNTVKYRIKKMEKNLGVKSRRELLGIVKEFDLSI